MFTYPGMKIAQPETNVNISINGSMYIEKIVLIQSSLFVFLKRRININVRTLKKVVDLEIRDIYTYEGDLCFVTEKAFLSNVEHNVSPLSTFNTVLNIFLNYQRAKIYIPSQKDQYIHDYN